MNDHYYKLLDETVLVHLVWLIPVFVLIFLYDRVRRGTMLKRIAGSRMLGEIRAELSSSKRFVKSLMLIIVAALIIFAIARPAWNPQEIVSSQKGRDVVFLLDVSKSMLAEDLKPSRLEAAKLAIDETIDNIEGDKVGLIAFAGNASILCPLTVDYSFFKTALAGAGANSVDVGGTMLADAVRKSLFDLLAGSESKNKDIVIITDGGDADEADNKFAIEAARDAANLGVRIITIGIGDDKTGNKIPYTDQQGNHVYLKYEGKEVVTRLNSEVLRAMARATQGGAYVNVGTSAFDFPSIYDELIGQAEKNDIGESTVTSYTEGFQYVLIMALFILVAEYLLNEKRRLVKKKEV